MGQPCRVDLAAPADQPRSVQQIADLLFPAYTVDGGRVSLAGCALEDRLVLELQFRHAPEILKIYLNAEGKEVDGVPIASAEPIKLVPLERSPGPVSQDFDRLLDTGVRLAAERLPHDSQPELIAATAVWCKYVEGKLRFTIGEATVDLPFSGWTRSLIPPRFACPQTGTSTFHLSATDDGRIVAADRIERCAETGRRMLATELIACTVTGRRVAPELIEICPISGRRLLKSERVTCSVCHQRVSPAVMERNVCLACRKLKRVNKADPRMARLLHEHPDLDRWRHWRIGETSRVYVLVASGWLKRLLVVVDKDSLEFKFVATGSRTRARWAPVEPAQYPYVLSE